MQRQRCGAMSSICHVRWRMALYRNFKGNTGCHLSVSAKQSDRYNDHKNSQLQEWVDYANKNGAIIIYDAAYEAYISEDDVAHSIYECEGAKTCAIEIRSFSKNAGFTGVRLGFTVVPKDLKRQDVSLHGMWARRHGTKIQRRTIYHPACRRSRIFRRRKSTVKRAGRLLYEKCICN